MTVDVSSSAGSLPLQNTTTFFFFDCGAVNPFSMASSDLLSGLSKGAMLMSCDRNPIILLTQTIQEKPKQSEGLRLLMHLSSLSVGSERRHDLGEVHSLVFCVIHWSQNETQKIKVGSWCNNVWGGG